MGMDERERRRFSSQSEFAEHVRFGDGRAQPQQIRKATVISTNQNPA